VPAKPSNLQARRIQINQRGAEMNITLNEINAIIYYYEHDLKRHEPFNNIGRPCIPFSDYKIMIKALRVAKEVIENAR
jgi:hypothetical protein